MSHGVLLHRRNLDAGHSHYSIFQGSSELPFRIFSYPHNAHSIEQRNEFLI